MPEPYDGDIHYFESQMRGEPILGAGIATVPIRKRAQLALQPHEWKQLKEDHSTTVFAFGYIFYRNDAGQHHRTGFCYRYDAWSWNKRFYPVTNDSDLSYEY